MITKQKKAKLIWACRRGMLELDLILRDFITHHLDRLTDEQITSIEFLLSHSDPELYAWLMGHEIPLDKDLAASVAIIRFHNNI